MINYQAKCFKPSGSLHNKELIMKLNFYNFMHFH